MSKGAIYLITQRYLDSTTPCVIPLWKSGDQLREVHCTDIYHPVHDALTTQLLTISRINAFTGTVEATTSLTSQISGTTLYMNADRIYIAYPLPADQFSFLSDFLLKDGRILLTDAQATRIQKLQSYDLSAQTKLIELNSILSAISRIDKTDEGLLKQNKLQNAFDSYLSVHANDIQRSVLYAYDSDDLALRARGTVPGTLLNQFSMDEYAGHLRVATTIEPTVWIPGVQTNRQSVSQVSILDAQLQPVGTIGDLGKTERIYAVRFIGERGYVVTFRQTDPFYVLDLSVPTRPTMAGELKIPGYSGYLHPLSDGTILGIGMEGSRVKLAQFDVSDPRTPTERSKFILTDQYSGAVYDHHAFLYDAQKGIIFVPGDRGGYLFTHARGLNLEKAVAASNARRAHYVNDVIYILTADSIIAVDENTYETIGTYKFPIAPSPAPVLYDGLEMQKAR
jgi:uncharacterized secreted protein with C-terminal beta-propeller domain